MAALEVDRSTTAPAFSSCNIVSLYCIDKPLYLNWESVDIVSVNLRHCHISLASSMRQRHYALIADRQQWGNGHQNFPAPKLLRVTSSFVVKWFDEDGEFSSASCIWEWEIITSIPPNVPAGNLVALDMPEVKQGYCPHCCPASPSSASADRQQPSTSSFDHQQPSTSSGNPQQPPTDTHSNPDASDESDDDQPCEAHIVKLRGSTLETRYQEALEEVREEMLTRKRTVPIRLHFEPDNPVDSNAIKIEAEVSAWKIIGYIPVHKIPKVTSAMRNSEIVSLKLAAVPKFEFHPVKNGFGASIVIVKKGKWLPDDRNNVYNSDLSYI